MRKPSKKRYLNAITHQDMAEIPFQENQVDISHINMVLGTDYALSTRNYEIAPEHQVEFAIRLGNDMVYVASLWELGRKVCLDESGRKHYVDGEIKTRDSFKKIIEPDLGEFERRIDGVLKNASGTGLGVIVAVQHVSKLVTVAMGYQDYMIALYDIPDVVKDFQKRCAAYCDRELEMVLSKPIDVVQTPVDICMQSGSMYSPDILEEYEFPYLRQTIQRAKAAQKATILHIDGYFIDLIPTFIDMGVDIINPVEPCANQDIVDLKRQFGAQLAFQGNLDVASVLSVLSPGEVRQRARALVEAMAPGGGFILASSHDIGENIPWENVLAMRDAAVAYGTAHQQN